MNIIDQLKANEKPFGLMSEETRKKMISCDKADMQVFVSMNGGTWVDADQTNHVFCGSSIHRLRPDYKEPEPEIAIREMEISANMSNCLCMYNDEGQSFGSIANVHERADFIGFKFEDGEMRRSPISYTTKAGMGLAAISADKISSYTILHATHVLFKGD